MDRDQIFERINRLLEDTDYPVEITDIEELEEFLNDDGNSEFDAYEEIGRLYDQLMEESYTDE